jgi:hypothetical protein
MKMAIIKTSKVDLIVLVSPIKSPLSDCFFATQLYYLEKTTIQNISFCSCDVANYRYIGS